MEEHFLCEVRTESLYKTYIDSIFLNVQICMYIYLYRAEY